MLLVGSGRCGHHQGPPLVLAGRDAAGASPLTLRRGSGHHSAAALIAMIYLCCGGLTIQ